MNSQSEQTTVPCPSCGQPLVPPRVSCASCGIALTGPDAVRLWEVDQQLSALRTERHELLVRLRNQAPGSIVATYPRFPAPAAAAAGAPERAARGSLSGQQLILGLGAMLLLSAAALFTVVVWLVVGLVGQAAILTTLVAVAVAGCRLFARRGLAAAAETAAVIAVGLTLVGANAAHARGLGDLDRFPADGYWAVALLVCGCLFLGFDRIVSSASDTRPIWVYPPAAAAVLSAAPWCLLGVLDVTGLAAQAGVGIAAVLVGGAALLTRTSARRPSTRAAALLAAVVAVAGGAVYVCLGIALTYDTTQPAAARYTAAILLLLAAGATHWTPARDWTPALVTATLGVVVPAALLEAPYQLVAIAAVPLAGASALLLRSWPVPDGGVAPAPWGWSRSVTAGALWLQLVLFAVVVVALDAGTVWWWAPVLPAAALLVVAAAGLWLFRSAAWVCAVQAALAATVWSALLEAPALATFATLVGLTLLEVTVAILVVRGSALLAWLPSAKRPGVGPLMEQLALAAAALCFLGSWVAAALAADEVEVGASVLAAIACYVTAVSVYVYAGQPRRLAFAYVGTLLTSLGSWLLLDDRGVSLVEAYTLPPALLLALVGAVTHRRARRQRRQVGSMLTMGPALTVALGPSTFYAITEGDTLRTALVVAAGLACLLGGFGARVKAPVLAGSVSLGLVAVTSGGPYLAYLPGWITIGAAGALLLAIGVSWESAVVAGRRSTAWFGSLR